MRVRRVIACNKITVFIKYSTFQLDSQKYACQRFFRAEEDWPEDDLSLNLSWVSKILQMKAFVHSNFSELSS